MEGIIRLRHVIPCIPRILPASDFRSRRRRLTPRDFVFSSGREERPSDLIRRAQWNHIVILPDDVAIRTTNHHGTAISQLLTLSHVWIDLAQPRDPMTIMLIDAHDDFQASLYNAIAGFYRVAISASRKALELLAIGTWAQLCGKRKEFREYLRGNRTLSFGTACDGLSSGARSLEAHLQSTLGAHPLQPGLFETFPSPNSSSTDRLTFSASAQLRVLTEAVICFPLCLQRRCFRHLHFL